MKPELSDPRGRWPWGLLLFFEVICAGAAYGFLTFAPLALAAPSIWPSDKGGAIFALGFGGFMTFGGLCSVAMMIVVFVLQLRIRTANKK